MYSTCTRPRSGLGLNELLDRCPGKGFWRFVSPSAENQFLDECGLSTGKRDPHTKYFLAPEERFSALRSKVNCHGAMLLINEDVRVRLIRRKSHEYLASDPK